MVKIWSKEKNNKRNVMKKLFVLLLIMFVLGSQASFAQTKQLSCQAIQQKLGNDKMLRLYWAEKLGESILANGMFHPSKIDSVWLGKKLVTASYYVFFKNSVATMGFKIIVYNEAYDLSFDEEELFKFHARFLAYGENMKELSTYTPIKNIYLKLIGKDAYEPSQQELEEVCKRLSY